MTQLSDTQALILSAAAQRPAHIALPLPESLRGSAATKVVDVMITKGLLQEVDADLRKDELMWRETGDGHGTTLVATEAGLAAIGIETGGKEAAPEGMMASSSEATQDAAGMIDGKATPRTPREGTKQARMIAMLRMPAGATIEDLVAATNWAPHTVRGALSGAIKKKMGLTVTSTREEDRGRVYRLVMG